MTVSFLSVQPKAMKLKVSPRFPALLIGRTGIAVNKANGNYYLDLAYQDFPVSPVVPANQQVLVYDPVSGNYVTVPAVQFGGGISADAPLDGFAYGRQSITGTMQWSRVLPLVGGFLSGPLGINNAAMVGTESLHVTGPGGAGDAFAAIFDGANTASRNSVTIDNTAAASINNLASLSLRANTDTPQIRTLFRIDAAFSTIADATRTATVTWSAAATGVFSPIMQVVGKAITLQAGATLTLDSDPSAAKMAATKQYVDARAWQEVPQDAFIYGRTYGGSGPFAWAKTVPEAPSTGIIYGRQNGAWVAAGGTSAVPPRSYLAGLGLANNASFQTNFNIAAGLALDSTNTQMMALASSLVKTNAAFSAGNGGGSLDAALAVGWWHVFLIMNVSTSAVDVVCSQTATPASGPTNMPSGFTLFRRLGSLYNLAGNTWRPFVQLGDDFLWVAHIQDIASATQVPNISAFLVTLSVPPGVQVEAKFQIGLSPPTGGSNAVMVSALDEADQAPFAGAGGNYDATIYATSVAGFAVGRFQARTSTGGQIRLHATNAAAGSNWSLISFGYTDRRGRDA
jgi:hypothetical protein